MTTNKQSTKYFSEKQENSVAKALGGMTNTASGAGKFNKGDVLIPLASMLVECKTCVTEKESFSIKKDWISKNKEEAFAMRMQNHCVAFNFGPDQPNYYVIDESLMKFLVEKIIDENAN